MVPEQTTREAFLIVACEAETWVDARMERLERLYSDISQQANNFARKQQGFFPGKEWPAPQKGIQFHVGLENKKGATNGKKVLHTGANH